MRGQRVPLTENPDGEIDEQFWANAANQAAGRDGEGDDSMSTLPLTTGVSSRNHPLQLVATVPYHSTPNSSMTTTTTDLASTMRSTADQQRLQTQIKRKGIYSLRPLARRGAPALSLSNTQNGRNGWTCASSRRTSGKGSISLYRSSQIRTRWCVHPCERQSFIADLSTGHRRGRGQGYNRPRRSAGVQLRRRRSARRLSSRKDGRDQHELLLHLPSPSCQRAGPQARSW